MDKRRKHLRTRLFLGVALGMTGLILIAYAFHFSFFEGLERQSIDMRFSLRGSQATPGNLAVVNAIRAGSDRVSRHEPSLRTSAPDSTTIRRSSWA